MAPDSTGNPSQVARSFLLSTPDPPSLASCPTNTDKHNAAHVFLLDFSNSLASFARPSPQSSTFSLTAPVAPIAPVAPTAPTAPTTRTPPNNQFHLSAANFPALGQTAAPAAPLQPRKAKPSKRITPSRVPSTDGALGESSLKTTAAPSRDMATFLSDRGTSSSRSNSSPRTLASKPVLVIQPVATTAQLNAFSSDSVAIRSAMSNPVVVRAAKLHASLILNSFYPAHTLCTALLALADALRLGQMGIEPRKASVQRGTPFLFKTLDAAYAKSATFCAHAVLCISTLLPVISSLPEPVRRAFVSHPILGQFAPGVAQLQNFAPSFPSPKDPVPFSARSNALRLTSAPWEDAPVDVAETTPRKLIANLENVWDRVIDLQRIHRGDNARLPAGTLQRDASSRAVGALHPANMDAFAARFISLVTASALRGETESDRLARLSARMTSAQSLPVPLSSKIGKQHSSFAAAPGGGVILHRIPGVVRDIYSGNGAELFFLEFIDGADSAKLCDALAPRLSAALCSALVSASGAQSDDIFTDAVLLARLNAKMLSCVMHLGNWAHSSASFSAEPDSVDVDELANSLPAAVARMRAACCSASWKSCIDLAGILHESLASSHAPAVVAALLVADVVLRLAVVDPVAAWTPWFSAGVDALREVDTKRKLWLSDLPIVRCIVEELLFTLQIPTVVRTDAAENSLRSEDAEGKPAGKISIGDTRLIKSCIPCLEDVLRKLTEAFASRSPAQPGLQRRRIRPVLASTGEVAGTAFRSSEEAVERVDPTSKPNSDAICEAGQVVTLSHQLKDFDNLSLDGAPAELWAEFFRRMDKRLRDVVNLVTGTGNFTKSRRKVELRDTMRQVAALLIPDTPQSAVDVAAEYCGALSQLQNRSRSKSKPGVSSVEHVGDVACKFSERGGGEESDGVHSHGHEDGCTRANVDEFVDAVWQVDCKAPVHQTCDAQDVRAVLSKGNVTCSFAKTGY